MMAGLRRLIGNLYVQHIVFGLIFATVLCVWFTLPPNAFWVIVIAWPFILALWIYAFLNGTIPEMNL